LIARSASRGEWALDLLPAEFKLLEYLLRRSGQTVTRTMLLEDVGHYRFMPRTNLVESISASCGVLADLAGGSAGLAGNELRRRPSVL